MNELDKLRPEVREALDEIDDCMRMDIKVVPVGALGVVTAELLRLSDVEAELAALKARFAAAPQCDMARLDDTWCALACSSEDAIAKEKLGGKRVRLVVEE